MKTIIMVRHGYKTPENHITPECLMDIVQNGIQCVGTFINRIHLGSACIRTAETAMAFATWLLRNRGQLTGPVLLGDARLGSDELFSAKAMVTEKFRANVKAGMSNFVALHESASAYQMSRWTSDMREALSDIFDHLNNEDICLSVTHSPTIEMLADSLDLTGSMLNFKELGGVVFTEDEDDFVIKVRLF